MSETEDLIILIKAHRWFNSVLKNMANGFTDIQIIEQLTSIIENLFPGRIASLLLVDEATQKLHLSKAKNNLPDYYNKAVDGGLLGANIGSCGAAGFFKKPYIVEDIYTHPNWQPFVELVKKASLRACWSMPILSKNDILLGTFAIYCPVIEKPSDYELEILETAANLASIALDKKQLLEKASTDSLTSLHNRYDFERSFEQMKHIAIRNNQTIGIVFIDLNHFKRVNDTFGHRKGDDVLIRVANVIKQGLRKTDLICRYGGDEFLFASIDINKHFLQKICLRISCHLDQVIDYNIKKLEFGMSFGGVVLNINSDTHIKDLIQCADSEMYKAKKREPFVSIVEQLPI